MTEAIRLGDVILWPAAVDSLCEDRTVQSRHQSIGREDSIYIIDNITFILDILLYGNGYIEAGTQDDLLHGRAIGQSPTQTATTSAFFAYRLQVRCLPVREFSGIFLPNVF